MSTLSQRFTSWSLPEEGSELAKKMATEKLQCAEWLAGVERKHVSLTEELKCFALYMKVG